MLTAIPICELSPSLLEQWGSVVFANPRTEYDPYHPLLDNGRVVVIVTNIPIHAEQ